MKLLPPLIIAVVAACGGAAPTQNRAAPGASPGEPSSNPSAAPSSDPNAEYKALDVGADYETYHKVTKFAHLSKTHGGRLVDIWVNDLGYQAYIDEDAEIPVGTIIVKSSWETKDGEKTGEAGPLFIMEKRPPGFSPEHGDWFYGMHWAQVPEAWRSRMGGASSVYWRSPSSKVDYCWKCHDNYDRELGMPAKEARAF